VDGAEGRADRLREVRARVVSILVFRRERWAARAVRAYYSEPFFALVLAGAWDARLVIEPHFSAFKLLRQGFFFDVCISLFTSKYFQSPSFSCREREFPQEPRVLDVRRVCTFYQDVETNLTDLNVRLVRWLVVRVRCQCGVSGFVESDAEWRMTTLFNRGRMFPVVDSDIGGFALSSLARVDVHGGRHDHVSWGLVWPAPPLRFDNT
jgi:hypothetical protein